MGYYRDDYMIFTSQSKERLEDLQKFLAGQIAEVLKATDHYEDTWKRAWQYLGKVSHSLAGGNYRLALLPDDSKEGWDVSLGMDDVRLAAKEYVDESNWKNGEPSYDEQIFVLSLQIHESYDNRDIELK